MTAELDEVLAGSRRWAVVEGDCLEVLRALPDKCGVVVTDFPYGIGKSIANDRLPWPEWLVWIDDRLRECLRVGRMVFSFFAPTRLVRFIRETTVPPQFVINWHKPMMLHGRALNGSPFLVHHEVIIYWGPLSPKEAGKRGYDSFAFNSMWPHERRAEGVEHPTPKPLDLMCQVLKYWSDDGDLVIDPFCGSGSTLVGALRNGRRCIGIDIDPQWVTESTARLRAEEQGSSLGAQKSGQTALFQDGGS